MADSCWRKFSFIRKTSLEVQDIWKDRELSKWLLSPLDQKCFQELVFKAFKNHKRNGCVDRQQVRSIDRNVFFFFKLIKLLIFRRWWQLWMKTKTIHQSYRMNSFFRNVSLLCFTADRARRVNWFTIDAHVLLRLRAGYVHTNNCVSVFCFSPLFCSSWHPSLKTILKQLFALCLVNIGEYLSRWIFTNVHFALGE